MEHITVRLYGGVDVPIPGQVIVMDLPAGTTVGDLLDRLEQYLGVDGLAGMIAEHCLVAVNGMEVGHLGGWQLRLTAGSVVSVVPAMVGG